MIANLTTEKYLGALLAGDRRLCRSVIEEYLHMGIPANRVYMDILWPMMVEIDNLYRQDRINSTQEHLASRINRTIVDQLQNKLPRKSEKDKKIIISCAATERSELGAQMIADLFDSDGWDVKFLGGGVSNEDLLQFVGNYTPDILLIFGSTPQQAPAIRALIDHVKGVDSCPQMRIMLSGGVFCRVEGLWEEIGADIYAETAMEAVELANMSPEKLYKPIKFLNKRRRDIKDRSLQEAELMAQ